MRQAEQDALPAETISRLIDKIIRARRPRTSYVVHTHRWRVWLLTKLLPARWTDRLLAKRLALRSVLRPGIVESHVTETSHGDIDTYARNNP